MIPSAADPLPIDDPSTSQPQAGQVAPALPPTDLEVSSTALGADVKAVIFSFPGYHSG